jgi:glycine oxidase
MGPHPDVIVLGGGVVGLTTAYTLARDGARVAVLDRAAPGQESSWAGAGIVPPGVSARAATPLDRLRAWSSEQFPALSAELHERTGLDNGYHKCGGIEFLSPEEAAGITRAWRDEGVVFEPLPAERLRWREPALAEPPAPAYWLPGMAQVRNPRHIKALVAACEQVGAEVYPDTRADGFDRAGDRLLAVRTPAGAMPAGAFLVASGAWADELLAPLGCPCGVRPVRGQIVLLDAGRRPFRPILLTGRDYLVPRDDGRVLVGATEEDAGFEKRTTAAAVARLIGVATRLVPALAEAQVERAWAGLRPGSPDGLPFLGRIPGTANGFVAAGHYRAGIQLSPGTARVIADLVRGREPVVPVVAFRPGRPPSRPVQAAFRS